MRYKSIYPDSYNEGRGNVTVSVSAKALMRLQDIGNASAYINDLIIADLDEKIEVKSMMAQTNKLKSEMSKHGYDLVITRRESGDNEQ